MGLDVALEEINHLLEVDLTDNTRPRLSGGKNIIGGEGVHHLQSQVQHLRKGLQIIFTSHQLMRR